MRFIPNSVSRTASRTLLKTQKHSPTILVVSGVIGLGATAVMAARATRKIDPVLEEHKKLRWEISEEEKNTAVTKREHNRALLDLYTHTGIKLGKIYGPSIFIGTASAISVLGGHKILVGRHVASMAAYSGLFSEFNSYRHRVAETFGEEKERAIYNGGKLKYVEDPNHKGEYKLEAEYPEGGPVPTYLRPWIDDSNPNYVNDPRVLMMFLKGVQQHMNHVLQIRGHVSLNDVNDALRLPRSPEGQLAGWAYNNKVGEDFIDFGLFDDDPHTVAFREGVVNTVQLNFNIQGMIYDLI